MPRKRGPGEFRPSNQSTITNISKVTKMFVSEGKPKHYAVPPEQMIKQEAFVHSNPPKGMEC